MTIKELMENLAARFDGFKSQKALEAWTTDYRALLGASEGAALAQAWRKTMDGWAKATFPKPVEIWRNLPELDYEARHRATEADRRRRGTEEEIDRVMRSDLGGTACNEGWGHSLWIDVRDGKEPRTIAFYRNALYGRRSTVARLDRNRSGDATLIALSAAMDHKNRWLAAKYGFEAPQPEPVHSATALSQEPETMTSPAANTGAASRGEPARTQRSDDVLGAAGVSHSPANPIDPPTDFDPRPAPPLEAIEIF